MSEERKVHVDERRLTCAVSKESVYCLSGRNDSSVEKAIVKLGQLEDLEDELGIDLLTLMKALKDGIYGKVGDSIEHILSPHLCMKCEEIYIFKVKDYGKTWALTKEELEK